MDLLPAMLSDESYRGRPPGMLAPVTNKLQERSIRQAESLWLRITPLPWTGLGGSIQRHPQVVVDMETCAQEAALAMLV